MVWMSKLVSMKWQLSGRFQAYLIIIIIIPPLRHFTILGQKNAQNMPRYYTVEQGKNTDWGGATKWLHKTNRTLPWLFNGQTFYWNGRFNRTDRNFGNEWVYHEFTIHFVFLSPPKSIGAFLNWLFSNYEVLFEHDAKLKNLACHHLSLFPF